MPRIGAALNVVQVPDPATPSVGRQFLYFKSDGLLYSKNSAGLVSQVGGAVGATTTVLDGGATPDEVYDGVTVTSGGGIMPAIVDVKGDLLVASGADTVTRFPVGATTGHILAVDPVSITGMTWVPAPISGRLTVTKLADENISVLAFTDIIDLSFPMLANTSYDIDGTIFWTVAAATTGWRWGVAGPGLATASVFGNYVSTTTAEAITTQSHANTALTPSMVALLASPFAVTPNLLRYRGYIRNGATAGPLRLQFSSELAGTAVTVLRGSKLTYRQV